MRRLLTALLAFLAATAVAGGIGLMSGQSGLSTDLLSGSPFSTYFVPGLVLCAIVGGSAAVAAVQTSARRSTSRPIAFAAAVCILCYEAVEIAVVGSPDWMSRTFQLSYIAIGIAIAALAATADVRPT